MTRNTDRFSHGQYDVCVIGGGINGAAVANMAATNGMRVALLEKGDFSSGTSSKSTKLIHGGLRYLENFEFDLVREALFERSIQLKSVPHLVKPLGFIIPVYKNDKRPLWFMQLGVALYDFLSGKHKIYPYRRLTADEIIHLSPGINEEGLKGGLIYYDAQMNDARVCLENVLSARQKGAHVVNYVEVKSLIKENGKTVAVQAEDLISGGKFKVRAKNFVCAVGPWVNEFIPMERSQSPQKLRTTKGVHIVYRKRFCEHALLLQIKKDARVFFMIPWMGGTLIGTTDTDYKGSPDDVRCEEEDIEYLFQEAKRVFPKHEFSQANIMTTFAGLRPLVYKEGSPSKISRKHVIEQSFSGIYYIMGGKYTTFRKIAEDCIRKVTKNKFMDTTQYFPLYGSGVVDDNLEKIAREYKIDRKTVEYLIDQYGSRYRDVLSLTKNKPSLKEAISSDSQAIKAQIVYAVNHELAQTPEDIIQRRLDLHFHGEVGEDTQKLVEKAISKHNKLT